MNSQTKEKIEGKAIKLINDLEDGYYEYTMTDTVEFEYDGIIYHIEGYLEVRTFDDRLCGDGPTTSTTYISGVVGIKTYESTEEIVIKFEN